MSFTSGASRSLLRRWKSVPLPTLTQGSTISITSTLNEPAHVVIQPEWRDTGHVELVQQGFSSKNKNKTDVEMTITREVDLKTSLGRMEPHISIRLSTTTSNPSFKSSPPDGASPATVQHYLPSKTVNKVILDDGSVHPDSQEYSKPLPPGMKRVEYHDGLAHITKCSSTDDCSNDESVTNITTTTTTAREDMFVPSSNATASSTVLTVQVPEQINVTCDLQSSKGGGSISVRGKLEGDVSLKTRRGGNISVTKLRGNTIELVSNSENDNEHDDDDEPTCPVIYAKDLIEAQTLTISTTGRVRAKQIHGRSVNINVNHRLPTIKFHHDSSADGVEYELRTTDTDDEGSVVDISALFVSGGSGGGGASIQVTTDQELSMMRRRAVRVKSHHGALEVVAKSLSQPTDIDPYTHRRYPLVELGGVNGSCEVMIQDTKLDDDPSASSEEWKSCMVHVDSLLPDSVSLITCDRGNVSLTLDRKAECDLRLLSTSNVSSLIESGAMLAEEEDSDLLLRVLRQLPQEIETTTLPDGQGRISVETNAFTCTAQTLESEGDTITYTEGYVENKSHEPDSRFDRKSRGEGKIRLDGAAAQALQSFSKQHPIRDGKVDNEESSEDKIRPLIAIASTGRINVETVSWIGAIARRYGLDEGNRGIGRTASRRGRSIVPSDE